jgi:hypothetical protein|nr:hypothetical protein [uncultured Prevotella sp.]
MKTYIKLGLFVVAVLLMATSCHSDNDDYETTAVVNMTFPDSLGIKPLKVQGTVTMQNLNTKQTYSSSAFDGSALSMSVMRGAYSISVEGTVQYVRTDSPNDVETADFRASSDYSKILDHPTNVDLEIIFM